MGCDMEGGGGRERGGWGGKGEESTCMGRGEEGGKEGEGGQERRGKGGDLSK